LLLSDSNRDSLYTCDKDNLSHIAKCRVQCQIRRIMDENLAPAPRQSVELSAALPESLTALVWQLQTAHLSQGLKIDSEMLTAFASAAAPNSLRALKQDGEAFDLWCRRNHHRAYPATPQMIAAWLRERATEGAAPASLGRYKASLGKLHRLLGLADPTRHELVRLAIASHRRKVGSMQKQARALRFRGNVKDPLADTPRGIHVRAILECCSDDPTGLRNRALLSVAYDTGLRASELVATEVADIVEAIDTDARLLRIGRTKGDQDGEGATAYLSPRSVRAINDWLTIAQIVEGPIFRRVIVRRYAAKPRRLPVNPRDLSGRAKWDARKFIGRDAAAARTEYHIGANALHPGSLTFGDLDAEQAETLISAFSSHSTRVGLNQDLFAVGETLAGIMDALRWKTPKMPLAYNRNLAAEVGAAGRLLSKLD
jgi:site-specific recombinase XerD